MTNFSRVIRRDYYTTPRSSLEAFGQRSSADDFNHAEFTASARDAIVCIAVCLLALWVLF